MAFIAPENQETDKGFVAPENQAGFVAPENQLGFVAPENIEEEKPLTLGQTAGSLAIDVGGSIGSQALGYSLAPFTLGGSLVIPFLGGMASSITAQMTAEGKDMSDISFGRALSSGMLNMIPVAATIVTGKQDFHLM